MDENSANLLDDLLNLTDTEDSTSSSNHQVFEGRQPFVLELHDLQRDDPANPHKEVEKKRKKKRKNQPPTARSNTESSSSASESSIPPAVTDALAKEQFFDAHESYHGLQEPRPTAVLTLGQSQSAHSPTPKIMDSLPPVTPPAPQPPSDITRQTPRPE